VGLATQYQWTSAARTHLGLVRSRNEDAILARPECGLWAVADGMGGHAAGDVASGIVVDALAKLPRCTQLAQGAAAIRARLQDANHQLRLEAASRGVPIVGSTAVVLLAYELECVLLWAGDSRAYRYRNTALTQLTRDHNQAEELKARHQYRPSDIQQWQNLTMLTRAVGAADTLEIDEQQEQVRDGDIYLLCSDGLSNAVEEEDIQAALADGDCAVASDRLIELALQNGGRDNISVIVIRVGDVQPDDKTMVNPAL
jgi:protein phosphatase